MKTPLAQRTSGSQLGQKQPDAIDTSIPPESARSGEDNAVGGSDGVKLDASAHRPRRAIGVLAFTIVPVVVFALGGFAGFLWWQHTTARVSDVARIESVAAARDGAAAMLTYQSQSVEKDLDAARDRMTGTFRDDYTKLIHDVVIPGAKEKKITALANITAAASLSAQPHHAVVLVYINQNVTVGNDAPADTASTVKLTLDEVGDRWLISGFDPI